MILLLFLFDWSNNQTNNRLVKLRGLFVVAMEIDTRLVFLICFCSFSLLTEVTAIACEFV